MPASILVPVLVRSESSSEVMFADFVNASLYRQSGEPAPDEVAERVFSELDSQEESPAIPYGQINEVLRTERNLAQENAKHIFRRN